MRVQKRLYAFPIVLLFMISCSNNYVEHKFLMGIPFFASTRSYVSKVGNKVLVFGISDEFVKQQPSWSPDKPLSIPVDKIVVIAKSELTKYATDPNSWQIQNISIDRILYSSNEPEKWIYIVSFCNGINRSKSDYINMPIGLNFQPIQGVFQ